MLSAAGIALLYWEYQTNYFGQKLGTYLRGTNAQRRPTGRVWDKISGTQRTWGDIEQRKARIAELYRKGGKDLIPDHVFKHRYTLRSVPETEIFNYLIFKVEPLKGSLASPDRLTSQDQLRELIENYATYQYGLSILDGIRLPREYLRREVESVLRRGKRDSSLYTALDAAMISSGADPAFLFKNSRPQDRPVLLEAAVGKRRGVRGAQDLGETGDVPQVREPGSPESQERSTMRF